ncbi:PQQ-binding-like beta-propeller repeat protein [Streptomyces sp. HUCO-GS316]|uniref:serine/threonine-protein kinase n=1 Tax=Streptomyces sp. HUCO-GS316 TaxID=2692198 RepID=UPI00136E5F8D|nr:serine/threonine-protein kinase [Streptomyces sp. HUCO-GS316]MXM66237.1 PQQ-binding-like beta-propeller repeat protein [Streptomyces sp. HUCO-GS316]
MAPQQNAGAGAEAELPEYAGHYRLESSLGSGGMGVVHLARSTSGMRVAVKVVHAEFARDPEFRGRFRQEVAAARRVSGAFTASVVDADFEAERPWMATLFIPGPTLSDHVKRNGPMEPDQLRRLMAGLAEALRDIHRVGVVHRDLKPSNVLLAEDGPKVIDFGISRPKDSELRTETGKLIGTPPFMAPEQFRRPREVGPAADVFALGSVMVHAATGRGPFDSDSPYVVAYQVVHDEPDLTGVPENLAPLVLRCLAKEPEDRPTPDELMRELRSVAASYETQAFIPAQRTTDARPPAQEPRGRNGQNIKDSKDSKNSADRKKRGPRTKRSPRRQALMVAGVLGLAVVAAFASVPMLRGGGSPAPKESGSPVAAAGFTSWETKPVAGKAAASQCSYGARMLLCAQPGVVFALDPSDGTVLWRHRVAESSRSEPPVLSGGLVQVSANDGQRLEALDPASGRTRWHRDAPAHSGTAYAGGVLLLTGADGTVTGVDGSSGETKWSRRVPDQKTPYFSSFGEDSLAYAASSSDDGSSTRISAVDPATGDVRWDAQLEGSLRPVGVRGGSVYFVAVDPVYEETTAVVRYTPGDKDLRRVALPFPLARARAAVHGDVVHLLAADGALAAVDLATGKQLWSLQTAVNRGSTPVVDDRHVFFTAADGRLLAVDARRGKLVGQTKPRPGTDSDRVAGSLPEPLISDGHVFAGAPDGTVFGVNGRNPSTW